MPDQVNESINSIIELTSRVDERVQLIMKTQKSVEDKIDAQLQFFNELNTRVKILESKDTLPQLQNIKELQAMLHKIEIRIHDLEGSTDNQENRWKNIFGFVIQLVWVVLAAILLYKLGLQAPDLP